MIARMSRSARQKLASFLGLVPLIAFLAFHAWETSAALSGRDAFVSRISSSTSSLLGLLIKSTICVLPILVHGVLHFIAPSDADEIQLRYRARGVFRLQQATGIATAAYLLWHLASLWWPLVVDHEPATAYDFLMVHAGQPLHFVAHAIGIACVSFHAALGAAAAGVTFRIVASDDGLRRARVVFGSAMFILYLLLLNNLSHFVAGRAFFGESHNAIQQPAAPEVE